MNQRLTEHRTPFVARIRLIKHLTFRDCEGTVYAEYPIGTELDVTFIDNVRTYYITPTFSVWFGEAELIDEQAD